MKKNNKKFDPYNFESINNYESHSDLIKGGKQIGKKTKKKDVGDYKVQKRNVFDILKVREKMLVKELLPVKYKRMSKDTFAFFRGTADVMDYDLKNGYQSTIEAIICGDAHLANFGFYASKDRQLLFDVNDFDESRVNMWEYDLKRFLVSALLVAEQQHLPKDHTKKCLQDAVKSYKKALQNLAALPATDRLLLSNTVDNIVNTFGNIKNKHTKKLLKKTVKTALTKNSEYTVKKHTKIGKDGKRKFVRNPPVTKAISKTDYSNIMKGYKDYCKQSESNIELFLQQCKVVDIVRHSVGVGSVGTLCYLMLLQNYDGTYFILQVKQALPITDGKTVYSDSKDAGTNIVNSQYILQSASDPFLGKFNIAGKSFYVRQFKDMKGSIDLTKLDWDSFKEYVDVCIIILAHAHSQSPKFPMIIGYLESHDWMEKKFVKYSKKYKKQVEADYKDFLKRLKKNG
ncbi:hypothetical protein BG262_06920 [Floricoccus penangensis]|uniref:DUF2252 domain-containing protein n=1 Tax=Floricoccus penangensis TaxID=1859475 RepID=A0A9Q5JF48_9LACT|nr:DUF2252 family protein [Floricoccus penangensis]OFI45723.1 hypothetical protein BG262_06920 [Floricoccus penangensis]